MGDDVITKDHIVMDLKRLGVREGDHIGLGVSFRSIGLVEGGPETLISSLMTVLGASGTIMIPAYTGGRPRTRTNSGRLENYFDPALTPANTGIVPETLRQRENALRSRHPHCSVVAFGRLARYLTESHDANAPAYMPYSRLAARGGKILSIGIGDKLVGFRHEAQYQAGLLDILPPQLQTRYRDEDGQVKVFIRRDSGGCVRRLPALVDALRQKGLVKEGKIGEAASILVDAREGLKIMTHLLKSDPTLNLCDEISCLWCREIERRMDLYRLIENRKYFQRYTLVRYIIASINWARLRRSSVKPSGSV